MILTPPSCDRACATPPNSTERAVVPRIGDRFRPGPFPQQRLDADARLLEVPGGGHLVDDQNQIKLAQSLDEAFSTVAAGRLVEGCR